MRTEFATVALLLLYAQPRILLSRKKRKKKKYQTSTNNYFGRWPHRSQLDEVETAVPWKSSADFASSARERDQSGVLGDISIEGSTSLESTKKFMRSQSATKALKIGWQWIPLDNMQSECTIMYAWWTLMDHEICYGPCRSSSDWWTVHPRKAPSQRR